MVPDDDKPGDLEREIDSLVDSIGMSPEESPASTGVLISERGASYIPDSEFDAASSASDASLTQKEASSPSVNERRLVIIKALQSKLGIKHWPRINQVHIDILLAAEAMYIRDERIQNDDMLRKVLLLALCSMNPKNYSPAYGFVMKQSTATLARALAAEFKKRRKFELAAKLEEEFAHLSGQFKAVKP